MVAQLLDEGGNPIGGEIMFGNPNSFDKPSVAYGDGKYFIVWAAAGGACLLDADGNVLMDEFSVLPKKELTFPQYDMYLYPSVTYDSDNKHFLVVAELDHYVSALLPFQFGIAGRLFNTDGTAVGEPFVISLPLTSREGAGLESYPAAAYDTAKKHFLVAWNKMWTNGSRNDFDIYGQLLDSNGTLLNTTADTNFVISDDITNDFLQSLTYDSNNNRFLPVWIKDIYGSGNSGLEGRLINGDGTMYGSSFIITDLTYYTHQYRTRKLFSGFSNPSQIVFKNNEDRYLALWSTDDPGLDYNVYGRYFSADGKNMEDPFAVSVTDQDETSVSAAYNSRTGDVRAALEVHCNGIPTTAVTNIIGKPAPLDASIEFSGEAYNINETAGQAVVTVIRSGNTDSEVTAAYSTKDGTAIAGTDYTAVSGTLTFAKGETEKTFSIPIIDDALSEADKTIEINLSDPSSGAVLGVKKTAYLTIVDDDNRVNNPPTAVSDTAATKEAVPVIIEVLKNDTDPDGDILVITDVTQGSKGKATINQDQRSVTYTPDADFTGEDTFTYTLSDGKDGIAVGTVTVTVTANTGTNPDHNNHTHKTPIPDEEVPGAPLLNRIDHIAYIQGYPDNSVKPEGYVTREEAAAVFFRLLDPAYRSSILNTNNIFGDVDANRWSSKYIATLSEGQILLGYPDGSFKPGNYITRAELATIAAKFDDSSTPDTGKFTDVSGSWAEKFINSAAQKGWVNGYPDGSFKPDRYITRAEFATLVNNVLDRKVHTENVLDGVKEFPDLIKGKWYFEEINEAVNSHHYERLPDGFEKWIDIYNPGVEM
jgi:hypothetical protein